MSDVTPDSPRLVQRWTRLASLALLLSAAGVMTLVVATLVFGVQNDDLWLVLAFTVVPLLGALLVNGKRWAWKVVGIVAGLLTAGGLFWTAFSLGRIGSFFDFVPAALVLPGALLGIVASVAALIRRNKLETPGTGPEQRWIRVVLALAAAATLVSSFATITSRKTADLSKANAALRMADFEFDRASYTFLANSTVYVRNDDPFFHTFTVDELGIDVALSPGSSTLVRIPAKAGSYLLYCRPHADTKDPADKGMAANVRVL